MFIRRTKNYRIGIDEDGIGHIRILNNVGPDTLRDIFQEILSEIKKNNMEKNNTDIHIIFYISKSSYNLISKRSKKLLESYSSCINIKFKIVLTDIKCLTKEVILID